MSHYPVERALDLRDRSALFWPAMTASPKPRSAWSLPPDISRLLRLFGFTILATLAAQSVLSCYAYQRTPTAAGLTLIERAQQSVMGRFF